MVRNCFWLKDSQIRQLFFLFLGASLLLMSREGFSAPKTIVQEFPALRSYLHYPSRSPFFVGMGLIPGGIGNNGYMLGASVFQLHYREGLFDIEIINLSMALEFALSNPTQSSLTSIHVWARVSPKIRILSWLSIGPTGGYEYLQFPNVSAKSYSFSAGNPVTQPTPFSTGNWVYGAELAEYFTFGGNTLLRIAEIAFQQTYSTSQPQPNWKYQFIDSSINTNTLSQTPLQPGWIFLLEASLLF